MISLVEQRAYQRRPLTRISHTTCHRDAGWKSDCPEKLIEDDRGLGSRRVSIACGPKHLCAQTGRARLQSGAGGAQPTRSRASVSEIEAVGGGAIYVRTDVAECGPLQAIGTRTVASVLGVCFLGWTHKQDFL